MKIEQDDLLTRAKTLRLWGLVSNWHLFGDQPWINKLLSAEEEERQKRSLQRRIVSARLGTFTPMIDFDWTWPDRIDREIIDELFSLDWLAEAINIILLGPNGVGKTMIARNLAYQALLKGTTVCYTTASDMLNELAAQQVRTSLQRRLKKYVNAGLLVIDEVGYLSYDNHHADLLFEVVSRRYQKLPIILTTNRIFQEWNDVFPGAACVVTMIDRLVHKSEIVQIEGKSYRYKVAQERMKERQAARKKAKSKKA